MVEQAPKPVESRMIFDPYEDPLVEIDFNQAQLTTALAVSPNLETPDLLQPDLVKQAGLVVGLAYGATFSSQVSRSITQKKSWHKTNPLLLLAPPAIGATAGYLAPIPTICTATVGWLSMASRGRRKR